MPRSTFASDKPTLCRAAAALLAACLLATGAALAASSGAAARGKSLSHPGGQYVLRHAQALQVFRAGRYADAYGRFVALADQGHAPSALIALVMARHGPSMFGSEWSASPGQLRRWSEISMFDVREHGALVAHGSGGE